MLGLALRLKLSHAAAVAVPATLLLGMLALPSAAATGTVDSLSPTYGPVGTVVDIIGTGLDTASSVAFNGVDAGVPAVVDDSRVQATVPDGASTGPVTVTTKDGTITGPSFTVQVPTTASQSVSPVEIVFPQASKVVATLTAAGVPVRGQRATLQRRVRGHTAWHSVQSVEATGKYGRVRWRVEPRKTSGYRVVFSDSTGYLGSRTTGTRVHVHPRVRLDVPSVAPTLTDIPLRGEVRPMPHGGYVVLERRPAGGTWSRVGRASVAGRVHFRFMVSFDEIGKYAFRARRPSDATHAAGLSTVGAIRAVQRSLHTGDTGPDVRALQRELTSLHFDVGGVTGIYNFDTAHAVVAFQKVQGLNRDGVAGTAVFKALDDPRRLALRHPADAQTAGIEVNLHRQVVIYAVNGKIRRILDASTGGGYYYTGSDGTQQKAITPTGHFHIVYKREGWVTSDLGTLYRPAYFNYSGYAIHGEGEVPPYPASHGCVRITVPAMDRFNSRFPVGLSFWIY